MTNTSLLHADLYERDAASTCMYNALPSLARASPVLDAEVTDEVVCQATAGDRWGRDGSAAGLHCHGESVLVVGANGTETEFMSPVLQGLQFLPAALSNHLDHAVPSLRFSKQQS